MRIPRLKNTVFITARRRAWKGSFFPRECTGKILCLQGNTSPLFYALDGARAIIGGAWCTRPCALQGFGISSEKIPNHFKGFEGILFAAIFSSGICSILQFVCQKHTTASKTSLIVSLETTFACIFAWVVGNDEFNWFSLIGLLLIMTSVIISNVSFKKQIDLTGIKFILFDADDTILDFQKSALFAFKKMLKHYQVKIKKCNLK